MARLFEADVLSKRERVERALDHRPVDRVPLHDQVSFNPDVIALYTGKPIQGFRYTYDDICHVIRRTLDACFPPVAPLGRERVVDADGFLIQHDQWTSWTVSRPFADVDGAKDYVAAKMAALAAAPFDPDGERARHRQRMRALQQRIGDDTVIIDYSVHTGFCDCWSRLGLDLFVYLYDRHPHMVEAYLDTFITHAVARVHAIADRRLSPVVLIAEDFATKRGPIFSPAMLGRLLFPHVRRLTAAWHDHGLKVLYHSDGNWRQVIPALIACGVDGFYCLEPAVGMDIVQLKTQWPEVTWAGGVDGVDLMERGAPAQVRAEVRRHIVETDALRTGGMLVGTSSEVNPPIQAANVSAMIEAVGAIRNADFVRGAQ